MSAAGGAPARAEQATLTQWAAQKREEVRALDTRTRSVETRFNEPVFLQGPAKTVRQVSASDRARNAETAALYAALIGRNGVQSLIWTGIESGNPLTRAEDYRWDSIEDQGLFDPMRRGRFIAELKRLGIVNVRVGMSNHRIDPDKEDSWREHDAFIRDLSEAGLNISLDLQHFGIEDRFRVVGSDGKTVGEKSYYLHPEWPDYFARFASVAFARYRSRIKAVTLVNEPETTVGFNGEMWHGAFPRWANPLHNFYYIERAVQVAKAALKARMEIEEQQARSGGRVLFLHPEAAVFKPYWSDFNRFTRFFVGDLMLGHEWLLRADLDGLARRPMRDIVGGWRRKASVDRTSFDWVIENYIVYSQAPAAREANRARLVTLLGELRELHDRLGRRHGVTMRSATLFGVDYYAHNEDKDPQRRKLSAQPQNYAREVAGGRRAGLYPAIVDYFNRYGIPIMIGETGTPYFHYGARWHQQMLLECARAEKDGVPFLGYALYPAIDTWGWETALSVSKRQTLLNPGGVLDLNMAPRPFVRRLLRSLGTSAPDGADPALPPPQALSEREEPSQGKPVTVQ